MSVGATIGHSANSASPTNNNSASHSRLRLWPAITLLVLFWAFLYYNLHADMPMGTRFISRMIAYAILLVGFTGWWLSRSVISWRDRLLAIGVVLAIMFVADCFADKSLSFADSKLSTGEKLGKVFSIVLLSLPWVFTVGTFWLLVSRSLTLSSRRLGFVVLMILTLSYFDLIRWDGLDAMQKAEISWRWNPTNESLFLASHEKAFGAVDKEKAKPWSPQPGDCLEYRGPNRDGIVPGTKIATDWQSNPPQELWRKKIGPAWSGMIVVDGHLVTQEQRGSVEVVSCYDAATGNEIWVHEDPIRFEEALSGAGPRGTPTFADGKIYAFGAKGKLNCLRAETGEVVWSHDVAEDAAVPSADIPQWGYSLSPLIIDKLVIVFAGGETKSLLAYNVDDGKLVWTSAGGKQSYSSPQLMTLAGERQILMHDTAGLAAYKVNDGTRLWQLPSTSALSMPMLQPHEAQKAGAIGDNHVVISTEPGATMLRVSHDGEKWSADTEWVSTKLRAGFNDFVLSDGRIFALDDGVLCCIDLTDGKRLWKKGRLGHGQILSLPDQGLLLISSDKGELILVSADRAGYKELGRLQAIEGKTWNGPVLTQGRVFLRNGEEMAAYDLNRSDGTTPGRTAAEKDH
ncbi:MAG TPA: PQQ-binding-like beta-propeller repeat protein [Lacipirellulaceae bacterium]|jgi:outer membrane protein assembly factor BamB|nr:PQQ-binding-like beta-propeller repeat protein [Lacipirellulaceae bacterium]